MKTAAYTTLSENEYLAYEAQPPVRNEYIAGKIFAMTGASIRHNVIAGNLFAALRSHLKGTPCCALIQGVKLRLRNEQSYLYPDVMVTCENRLQELDTQQQTVKEPVVVVEIASPSTEAIDRREKLCAYRTLPSLKEYLIVSQDQAQVEIYRRRGDIGWDIITYEPGDIVEITSLELKISIIDIYFESGIAQDNS
jgi:Uma2 family endonuclease